MSTTATTLPKFIATHGLRMAAEWAERNPSMADDDWSRDATHYRVTIKRTGVRKGMTLHYSMGSAHTNEPTLAMVLDSIASDAASVENAMDWIDWAGEMGFDFDDAKSAKRARETHATIVKQADALKALLGDDAYETLLWNTDRL